MELFSIWDGELKQKVQTFEARLTHSMYSPAGVALCVAKLVDCRPMKEEDKLSAMVTWDPGRFAWVLENLRVIESFPIKGRQGLFNLTAAEEETVKRLLVA